jgi:nitrogen fixation NifU-like protein
MALYSDVIKERYRQPRFRGRLDAPDAVFEDVNPLCGDRIRIELAVHDGRVTDARFTGDSCAISAASADLLLEAARGRTVEEAHALGVPDVLERLDADIRPARMKCVALPVEVLHGALGGNGSAR